MAAYPAVSAPYGLKPVNLIGGQVFAGSTRNFPIQYNYGTAIFYGDSVALTAGYATLANTSSTAISSANTVVGVFLGCYYTNPTTKQRQYAQYYPGNVLAGDITAIVADDPDVLMQVAATTTAGGTTIGSVSSILVGANIAGGTQTGSASTGNSSMSVLGASVGTTTTFGFRVVQLIPDTQISTACTYVSGGAPAATSVVVSGLAVGTFLPIGTDLYNLVNGQLQFTGATVSTAATVTTTGSTTLTVTAIATQVAGTVVLVQTPEAIVKYNFGVHRYNIA